jgi:hypothetical protein
MVMVSEQLLTTGQVARLLGVRTSTLFDLRRESHAAGIPTPCERTEGASRWQADPMMLVRWLGAVIEHRKTPGKGRGAARAAATADTAPVGACASLADFARTLGGGA